MLRTHVLLTAIAISCLYLASGVNTTTNATPRKSLGNLSPAQSRQLELKKAKLVTASGRRSDPKDIQESSQAVVKVYKSDSTRRLKAKKPLKKAVLKTAPRRKGHQKDIQEDSQKVKKLTQASRRLKAKKPLKKAVLKTAPRRKGHQKDIQEDSQKVKKLTQASRRLQFKKPLKPAFLPPNPDRESHNRDAPDQQQTVVKMVIRKLAWTGPDGKVHHDGRRRNSGCSPRQLAYPGADGRVHHGNGGPGRLGRRLCRGRRHQRRPRQLVLKPAKLVTAKCGPKKDAPKFMADDCQEATPL